MNSSCNFADKRAVIVGQGYVGLPLAVRAAESGVEVTGLDLNPRIVNQLNQGKSHIDDISDADLAAALRSGYHATDDPSVIADADVVIICVPTPLSDLGGPDLTAVESAARMVGEHISVGTLVVLESTTYPGTTEEIFQPLVNPKSYRLGHDINIAFSPERVDPGNASFGIRNTPKVVGGLTPNCSGRAAAFYSLFIDEVVTAKSAKEAELSKLIENTFRHVNIALMNEMLRFSRELNIDLWNAIDCAATKPFGFMPFRPGPGVGGHCIPIDPSYLSHRVRARLGYAFRMVELAEEINAAAPGYVASRIAQVLNDNSLPLKGSRILLLGVTYKPDISDCRESPASPLAKRLRAQGSEVQYHDPFVPSWNPQLEVGALQAVPDVIEAARTADLVVILQPHSSYDLDSIARNAKRILDTRGCLRHLDFPNVEVL